MKLSGLVLLLLVATLPSIALADNKVKEEPGVICQGGEKGTRFTEIDEVGGTVQVQCIPDNGNGTPVIELSPQQKAYVVKEQSPDCPQGQKEVWYKNGEISAAPPQNIDAKAEGYANGCEDIKIPERTLDPEKPEDAQAIKSLPFAMNTFDKKGLGFHMGLEFDVTYLLYSAKNGPEDERLNPFSRTALSVVAYNSYYRAGPYLQAGVMFNNARWNMQPGFMMRGGLRAKLSSAAATAAFLRFGLTALFRPGQNEMFMGKGKPLAKFGEDKTVGLELKLEKNLGNRFHGILGLQIDFWNSSDDANRAVEVLPEALRPSVMINFGVNGIL